MNRTVFGALVVVLFLVLYLTVNTDGKDILKEVTSRSETETTDGSSSINNSNLKDGDIRWTFEKKAGDENTGMNTTISLFVKEKKYEIGTYSGVDECREMRKMLFPGEASPYLICKWAGSSSGFEFGVFPEDAKDGKDAKLLLKKGVREEGDSPEYPAYRGDFEVVMEV